MRETRTADRITVTGVFSLSGLDARSLRIRPRPEILAPLRTASHAAGSPAAAVEDAHLPRHVAGVRRAEERDGGGHIVGIAETADRNRRFQLVLEPLDHRRPDAARGDAVDGHAVAGDLLRERLRQRD